VSNFKKIYRGGHHMERIQPSKKIRKELNEMINGISGKDFIMSEFFNKAAGLILQELLEKEVSE
jgi:hypothetical protein